MAYGETVKGAGMTAGLAEALGEGLRGLRKRAGLSLVELAHVMGREDSFYAHLSRLEHGRLKSPSLLLVADYLRACRARFEDLGPVLDGYTAQQPVRETRARETALSGLAGDTSRDAVRLAVYDRKVDAARRAAGLRPVAPRKRAEALSRQLQTAREQRVLSAAVEDEVRRLGVDVTLPVRILALNYGRMVWKALRQTEGREGKGESRGVGEGKESKGTEKDRGQKAEVKKKLGRPRKTREQRLAEAEKRAKELGPGILRAEDFRQVRERVERLFRETYPAGNVDSSLLE